MIVGQQRFLQLTVEFQLTHAQLTSPHSPPAMTTAKGVVGELPRAFARSCFALSYVIKYIPVPIVSRTRKD